MTTALSRKGQSTSYMAPQNFASALLDKISLAPADALQDEVQLPPSNLEGYITAIQHSPGLSGELKRTFLLFANEAKEAAATVMTTATSLDVPLKSELEIVPSTP